MARLQIKKTVNLILRKYTNSLYCDECWEPVYDAFASIRDAGFDLVIDGSRYLSDSYGNLNSKTWVYHIELSGRKKPIYGVLTAHGAGTVVDPLYRYDISAYVS